MKNLTYIHAPIGSNYLKKITQITSSHINNHTNIYIITSSNIYAYRYKKLISQEDIKHTPGQITISTILHLSEKILENQKIPYNSLAPFEEQIFIHKTILDYLKENNGIDQIRTLSKIPFYYNILSRLKEEAVNIEQVYELLKKHNNKYRESKLMLKLLAKLLEFEESERKYSNPYKILKSIPFIKSFLNKGNKNVLIIDGFYELTMLQKNFLQEFINNATNCYIRIIKDSNPAYEYCSLDKNYFGKGEIIYIKESNVRGKMDDFKQLIFKYDNYPYTELNSHTKKYEFCWDNEKIRIVKCANRESEVEIACKTVKHWILNGMDTSDICITYRGAYDYSKLLRFYCNKYGIPFKNKVPQINNDSLSEFILKLIDLNISNFERDKLIDFLRCNIVSKYFDIDIILKFEKISSRWGIIYGKKAWINACERRTSHLNLILKNYLEDEATYKKESIENEIKTIEKVKTFLNNFFSIVYLKRNDTIENYIKSILKITKEISPVLVSTNTYQILNTLYKALKNHNHKINLNLLYKILTNLLNQKVEYKNGEYGVTIVDVMNARGLEPEGMIILGLIDGEFPTHRYESKLELTLKKELNELFNKKIFDLNKNYLDEEQFLLYFLISSVKGNLMLTYPEFDSKSNQLETSPFIFDATSVLKSISEDFSIESYNCNDVNLTLDKAYNEQELLDTSSLTKQIIPIIPLEKYNFIIDRARIENSRIYKIYNLYNGNISKGISKNSKIADVFKKYISISRLHEYTKCPFYFACKNIWKIEVIEEPDLDIDRMTIGLIVHKLLEEFVKDFLTKKGLNPDLSWSEFLHQYREKYDNETIENLIKEFSQEIWSLPSMIRDQKLEFLKLGLKNFIDYETMLSNKSNYQPLLVEKEITSKFSELSLPNAHCNINFISKIDRIDYHIDYDGYSIIEYKLSSGSIPNTLKSLKEKRYLQIPFYLLMLRYNKNFNNKPILGGVYFSFTDGKRKNAFSKIQLLKRQNNLFNNLDELLNTTENILTDIIKKIYQGDFSVNPFDSNECRNCEYNDVCHKYD